MISNRDPKNINGRLYDQVDKILADLENDNVEIGLKERIAAMIAIGRIQTIFVGLRKESGDDAGTGTAVRKYSAAFRKAANGARGRKASRPAAEPDDASTDAWGDDADDAAA